MATSCERSVGRSRPRPRLAVVVLLLAAAFLGTTGLPSVARAAVPGAPPYAWAIEPIAAFADPGVYTSIALDASGNPYVSFVDGTNGTVDVAHRSGGAWTIERVDGPGSFFGDTNLVLAADGSLRISYYDAAGKQVKYAARTGTGWQVSVVDSGLDEGFNRLVLDAAGRPALAYVAYNGWLRYAAWNGTAWVRENVDEVSVLSRYPDLALDAAGNPHISYYADGLLRYAVRSNGVWTRELVDPSLYAGWFSRIQVGPGSAVHIVYYDSVNGTVRWATRANGTWSHTIIDGTDDSGWDLSLAVDVQGRTQIAYYARNQGSLRYAVSTATGWVRETVDEGGVVGWYTGIATDGAGLPHISFYDWTNGRLDLADGRIALQARTLGTQVRTSSSVLLRGELVSLGNHSTATVGFEFRVQGAPSWTYVANGSLASAGTYGVVVTNLTLGVSYEFRAEAASGNETTFGAVQTFGIAVPPPPNPYAALPYVALVAIAVVGVTAGYVLRRRRARRETSP